MSANQTQLQQREVSKPNSTLQVQQIEIPREVKLATSRSIASEKPHSAASPPAGR
jgi:hypothetical protein